jgi:hypothetical protein
MELRTVGIFKLRYDITCLGNLRGENKNAPFEII